MGKASENDHQWIFHIELLVYWRVNGLNFHWGKPMKSLFFFQSMISKYHPVVKIYSETVKIYGPPINHNPLAHSCYGRITDHIRLGLGLPFQSKVSIPSFCYGLNPISWGVKPLFVSEKNATLTKKNWNVSKLYKKNWTPWFPNVLSWWLPRCSSFFQQFSHLFPNWFQVLQSGSMYSCFPHLFLLPSFPICFQLYSLSQILFPINCPNCIPSASFNMVLPNLPTANHPMFSQRGKDLEMKDLEFPSISQKKSPIFQPTRWISQSFRGFNP